MLAPQARLPAPCAPSAPARHSFIGHRPEGATSPAAWHARLATLAAERRPVARGARLFSQGQHLHALYEVQAGHFKTCVADHHGRSQVTGFPMSGDLLGLGGIGGECHDVCAVALEDALVCVIPFEGLCALIREFAPLQHEFHKLMSREIVRDQALMLLLGTMAAEGRIAWFLLDMTQRLRLRGYSGANLMLRMTRGEIGSYLGLQLETVSRGLSKLQHDGVLKIDSRMVHVRDAAALARLAFNAG